MMKVVKFGGSSLADASGFECVKNIIKHDLSRKIVVVSAPGKSENEDAKVTDLLYLLYAHIEYGIDYTMIFERIRNRFMKIKNDLNLSYDIEGDFKELENSLNKTISKDFLVSRGEYFQAKLMAEYLGYQFVDSKDLIVIKQSGQISRSLTEAACRIDITTGIVVPGFYGKSKLNGIKLFSRGGSDLTGAILAAYLNADEYEKWTDVSGIFAANPSIVEDAKYIPEITYRELREMSYRGANVLHEDVITPIEDKEIPIVIKNTTDIDAVGTRIVKKATMSSSLITSIAGKQYFMVLNVSKKARANKIMVMNDVLKIFIDYNVKIEHIPSGIDTFSFIFDPQNIRDDLDQFIGEISELKDVTDVSMEQNISLVAVVGRNMANIPGIAGKLFSALGKEKINIKTVAQASTELSIVIGVADSDYENSILTIHKTFFEQ